MAAQDISIEVFKDNLRHLLMASPLRQVDTFKSLTSNSLGFKEPAKDVTSQYNVLSSESIFSSIAAAPGDRLPCLGLDPGYRNGCKWAVCDAHGDLIKAGVIFPNSENRQLQDSSYYKGYSNENIHWSSKRDLNLEEMLCTMRRHWMAIVGNLLARQALSNGFFISPSYSVTTIALGNGIGSRPTSKWLSSSIKQGLFCPLEVRFTIVSEAGASIYSALPLADRELPDVDVSLRGAVSLARRLQDPLAELVKIPPQHLGVGQYQHDLPQK
ncbi:unnamed protein product [Protopolystoma xenopodis]|uniref:Tex protein YqgF-like domain-containing protein n=1 Tax=Protopolystoma xenopodis TaxID=117903 RepID=A0A448X596_9PLAT|nr:unnamed protein product [Protopolystoma xenopodis]